MSVVLWILLSLLVLIIAILQLSTWHFKKRFVHDAREFVVRTAAVIPDRLAESDIAHLPEPVQRYLRFTQCLGKPKVKTFRVSLTGQLRQDAGSPWMKFSSQQYNAIEKPTRLFFLKAVMKHLPVTGYHRYREGEASMDIRLLSLFRVQHQTGKEMGVAETVTFFNDMCCMAPATLIDRRITWLDTNGNTVHAAFTTNHITISAWLYFNDEGALVNFVSDDRFALQPDGTLKRYRWSTPLSNYREINGYRLATSAEAIYHYPDSELCYGTFNTTDIGYHCTGMN